MPLIPIIIFFVIAGVVAWVQTQVTVSANTSVYIIKPGNHIDTRFLSLLQRWSWRFTPRKVKPGSGIFFEFKILSDPYDIRPDADQDDYHKMIGLPLSVFRAANTNSALVAFQSNPEDQTWDITAYFNENRGFTFSNNEIKLAKNEKCRGSIIFINDNKIRISITKGDSNISMLYTWADIHSRYTALILPYHGGKDNDGNGVGGTAPAEVKVQLFWRKIKA